MAGRLRANESGGHWRCRSGRVGSRRPCPARGRPPPLPGRERWSSAPDRAIGCCPVRQWATTGEGGGGREVPSVLSSVPSLVQSLLWERCRKVHQAGDQIAPEPVVDCTRRPSPPDHPQAVDCTRFRYPDGRYWCWDCTRFRWPDDRHWCWDCTGSWPSGEQLWGRGRTRLRGTSPGSRRPRWAWRWLEQDRRNADGVQQQLDR